MLNPVAPPFSASTYRTCIPIHQLRLEHKQNVARVEGATASARLWNLQKLSFNYGFLSSHAVRTEIIPLEFTLSKGITSFLI